MEQWQCKICLTNSKSFEKDQYPHILVPCGHSFCHTCIDKLTKCPYCRINIENKIH